ncbi:MAG TPA: Smr/MutS family protein [Thermoanaerobaculia bacterium]|nr:Smr/MutS family protein [Thermoanaerobaculia bacterium]
MNAGASPLHSSILSAATAQALELPSLLALLAHLAASDLGRERALALRPFEDEAELRAQRGRLEEVSRLLGDGPLVPDFELPLGGLLERLVTGRPPVEGSDLVRLADLGRATRTAMARVHAADPPCPGLAGRVRELPDLGPLLQRIDRTLDRRGEVREDASPRLAALRRQIRTARDQIYRELGEYVSSHRDDLSEETVPMRGGRLVVMLQSGARGRTGGLIHGRSATGKSFYFEPLGVVESNNSLQQSVEDEEAERRRILMELLTEARAALPALREHAAFLGELDLLQAAVRFADRCGGWLPDIGPRHELRLVAARHPLLDPGLADLREEALGQAGHSGAIVPLEIEISAERRILVVTGPNAGGKTVTLKTTGILALAAQCGLPIPAAAGSRVPFLSRVVATVGDEQDLLADRSTFSGRLLRLKEAWEEAGPDSLILLDELGSGTDPEEGAALAIALLEGLAEKDSLSVITTHLAQLAAVALELGGASCAAMEFDPETGRPTFRLLPGPPGASEALALARRLGLPAEWLDRAEARLGSEHRDLRRLLAEVERVRRELAETQESLETERADAEKLRRRLDAERIALEEERKGVARRLKADLDGFRRETADRLRQEVEKLRESFEAGRRRGLAAEAVERLFAEAPVFAEAEPEAAGPLAVGQPVRHLGLGWEGVLEKLETGRAEVLVRGKRVRCRPEELVPARGGASSPRSEEARSAPVSSRRPSRDLDEAATVPPELNLIGQRVESALEELDSYLDQALLASRKQVRVVHGHGTGRLRQAVREHLRVHPGVTELRPGAPNEGGNGATVVTLRGA